MKFAACPLKSTKVHYGWLEVVVVRSFMKNLCSCATSCWNTDPLFMETQINACTKLCEFRSFHFNFLFA